ncbi:hypothetical protein TNIN_251521 [Trichonephila inaurata madagascariensis]|uniref:Uncharacterized protein n=1 Tax=Trichonephila inaurata madagascariensis TaxID=2747483 RepID=A0A8X7CUC7_9ARAC|nr:hypothetical protein TNIN_251521 [Trichonephila inaurata madagascariensis]
MKECNLKQQTISDIEIINELPITKGQTEEWKRIQKRGNCLSKSDQIPQENTKGNSFPRSLLTDIVQSTHRRRNCSSPPKSHSGLFIEPYKTNTKVLGLHNKHKKTRQEVTGCKKRNPSSRSAGPERKRNRRPERKANKRSLASSSNSNWPLKKRLRESKESLQQGRTSPFHLRPRNKVTKEAVSRPSRGAVQGGPVRSRGELFRRSSP